MSDPLWTGHRQELYLGDCLEVMAGLDDASVDAVVTDPPYALNFMGKTWDSFAGYVERNGSSRAVGDDGGRHDEGYRNMRGQMPIFQAWCGQWAAECLRVLKPGGHLVAFGGTRTYHRMVCAIEDAGFEIRDSLHWLYGSGFPKSLDVSKAIDKATGAEREVIGKLAAPAGNKPGGASYHMSVVGMPAEAEITAPATEAAARWEGWGTALKPSHEPIVLARKPLAGTVAANVLEYGTGALNVNGCRSPLVGEDSPSVARRKGAPQVREGGSWANARTSPETYASEHFGEDAGRWPANILLTHSADCQPAGTRRVKGISGGTGNHHGQVYGARSNQGAPVQDYADADGMETVEAWDCTEGCPVAEMDRQSGNGGSGSGTVKVSAGRKSGDSPWNHGTGMHAPDQENVGVRDFGDTGGASRFFPQTAWEPADTEFAFAYQAKAGGAERPREEELHPTVKPLGIMLWLVRLITPPGGTVLDPFAGSGTTLEAAAMLQRPGIGIERHEPYARLAVQRLGDLGGRDRRIRTRRPRVAHPAQPSLFEDL